MKRTKPNGKMKKVMERIVGDEPGLASVARLFLYQNDDLFKLEVLASVLNDVAPDSPDRAIAELIERIVTTPAAKQEWVKQPAPIIGSTPCTPAPGSPLYGFNKFLQWNPCVLRIEGLERASGKIEVCATHVPLPVPLFMKENLGISDKVIAEWAQRNRTADRILWLLWEVFYRHIDLTRLKPCPVCGKWFVDHTKNKSKMRCSARCTWQRWSWDARKEAGHGKRKPNRSAKHTHARKA
jgi:endogenous inhibitor of DNA gyrase (YacG/DUF329 family)